MKQTFTGQNIDELSIRIQTALENVNVRINAVSVELAKLKLELADAKRYSFFGFGWFNSKVNTLEMKIEEFEWQQSFRKQNFNRFKDLREQLKLNPTPVVIDTDDARSIQFWSSGGGIV
jgi:uncharacterized protein (DUF1786 family)